MKFKAFLYCVLGVASTSGQAAYHQVTTVVGGVPAVTTGSSGTPVLQSYGDSSASALVSMAPAPSLFVDSNATIAGRTLIDGVAMDTATYASSTLSYRFEIYGAPDTIAMINFTGLLRLEADAFNADLNYLYVPGAQLLTTNQSSAYVNVFGRGGADLASAGWNLQSAWFDESYLRFSNQSRGTGALMFSSTLGTGAPTNLPYTPYIEGVFSGQVGIALDASGFGQGFVELGASAQMGASTFIDPYLYLDPAYVLSNPASLLVLESGVGNAAPVPEPSSALLLALGLCFVARVGLVSHARQRKAR